MHKATFLVAVVLALTAATLTRMSAAKSSDADAKGFAVAARADRSDRGYGDSRVRLKMVLRNRAGQESLRVLEITTLELADESIGDRSLVRFFSPGDIEGTALLSHAKILDPDDQWLYLPSLKRVKRISSANKSGPFVGSEFAYEDITGQELAKYEYTWLREEPCGEFICDVVERRPLYGQSGYTRQTVWVDQIRFQIQTIEYYDRKGAHLKTQYLKDYRQYRDRYWRPGVLRMVNHQTGKSTELLFDDYTFGIGLDEGDFVKGALRR